MTRRRSPAPALLVAAMAACAAPAYANPAAAAPTPATQMRAGEHPGFGRVVFDLPGGASYNLVTEGERLLVVFNGAGAVSAPARMPRNVRAIEAGTDSATLIIAPGAQARPVRMGARLVIDVLDPRPARTPPRPAPASSSALSSAPLPAPRPAPVTKAAAEPAPPPAAARQIETPAPPLSAPPPAPPVSPTVAAAPLVPVIQETLAGPAPAQQQHEPPPQPALPPLLLRADADVGAAAFRSGAFGIVVLDRRVAPPNLPPGAESLSGSVSTVLRLPLPPDGALRLKRDRAGWLIDQVATPAAAGLSPAASDQGLDLPLPRPGRVVTVLDPLTGSPLLVGTALEPGPDAGVGQGRRTPAYALLPTWLGVAVAPASDQVELRAVAAGFIVAGPAPATAPGPAATTASRRFDLPDLPPQALLNRLRAHLAGAAGAPVRARSRDRMAAAQDMIALGMGAEAQSLLQLAAAEDPQAAADAELSGLAALAAVLAGRPAEAEGLDDPRLDGSDEIRLWRGVRDRQLGRDTQAARGLGTLASLAQSYPATLQRLVWPEVAEAAVAAGLVLPPDRLPPYAAALALEREGKTDLALAALDAVIASWDRLDQVRAAARRAELLLSSGRISPADAAATLERQSFAWRGDSRETAMRLRAAELRGVAGEWRPALDALRLLEAQFPEQRPAIQARKATVLQAMLSAEGAGISAVDLVLLAADHADAVAASPTGAALARLLAEKLTALDLPARAIPVLQGLVRAAPAGPARAEFGARLAQLLLEGGDPAGAAMALEASAAPALPDALREARALTLARVRAARGDLAAAASGLFEVGTEAADDLRAVLLGQAGDWRGSLAALADLAARRVPPEGPLDNTAQDILLRQATAAAQAADPAMLRVLERSVARMTAPRADLFRLLTAPPLGAAGDLPRAARELALARTLPQKLEEMRSR